jgi:hypothetical protein
MEATKFSLVCKIKKMTFRTASFKKSTIGKTVKQKRKEL